MASDIKFVLDLFGKDRISLSFLYGWKWYYFIQGFYFDIKTLIANANPIAVIICLVLSLSLLLIIERKRLKISGILFSITLALYITFIITITVLGRKSGNVSNLNEIMLTYKRAISGDDASRLDILYNIVLYIPMGFLISRYKNIKQNIIILAAMPAIIEIIQLLTTRGVFELTDIINNFAGGIIGYGAVMLIQEVIRFIKDKISFKNNSCK